MRTAIVSYLFKKKKNAAKLQPPNNEKCFAFSFKQSRHNCLDCLLSMPCTHIFNWTAVMQKYILWGFDQTNAILKSWRWILAYDLNLEKLCETPKLFPILKIDKYQKSKSFKIKVWTQKKWLQVFVYICVYVCVGEVGGEGLLPPVDSTSKRFYQHMCLFFSSYRLCMYFSIKLPYSCQIFLTEVRQN